MLTFIVNPAAGNGLSTKVEAELKQLLDSRGIVYRFMHTDHPGHATHLAAKAAAEGSTTVVSVGGDGTAFEVACGLYGTGVPMGIIPAGTGNDFIKTSGTPKKTEEALDFILNSKPRLADICTVGRRRFLNVCGTGFDVTVLDYMNEAKKHFRGILPYLIGLVRAIRHYKPAHVRLTLDDGTVEEREMLICAIANGRYFGGGIPICPVADISDGLLDVVIVDHKPRWMIPLYLPALLMGKVLTFPFSKHLLCRRAEMVSPGMRLQIDGEVFTENRVEFSVEQGKLLLYW